MKPKIRLETEEEFEERVEPIVRSRLLSLVNGISKVSTMDEVRKRLQERRDQ